jgi:hypothetical protein
MKMSDELDHAEKDLVESPALPLTREALYKLVWSEPMLKVGARYKVSSSYMARVCKRLNVPRPERGYWSKLAVGKESPVSSLPDLQPGDEMAWSRDGQSIKMPRPVPHPPFQTRKLKKSAILLPDQHPLIKGAKALFEIGRESHYVGYLKPNKKLLPDLVISKTGIDKALNFANQLFLMFEKYGHHVIIAPNGERFYRASVDEREQPLRNRMYNDLWSPWRCTVVYIGTVAIGLTIIEMSEEVEARYVNGKFIRETDYIQPKRETSYTWTTTKEFPTGKLRLQAYSPYPGTEWTKCWQETKKLDLCTKIKGIVRELQKDTVEIVKLIEKAASEAEIRHREWEAQQEKWRIEEEERRAVEALKESKSELYQIISSWAEANRIEHFFIDAEKHANNLSENEKNKILERLKLARKLIGRIDALDRFTVWRAPDER